MRSIQVDRKSGAELGVATASLTGPVKVKGKTIAKDFKKKLNKGVLQAWPVAGGAGALLLVAKGDRVQLRYYDADADKGRWLGPVGFRRATLAETNSATVPWTFALAGGDAHLIVVGDASAIHARIADAFAPSFQDDDFGYQQKGQPRTVSIPVITGRSLERKIFRYPATGASDSLLQFFPDGHSERFLSEKNAKRGEWLTDGLRTEIKETDGTQLAFTAADLKPVIGVPARTRIVVRLTAPLSSRTAQMGAPLEAVVISPAILEGKILIPQGAFLKGVVQDAHGVCLAVKHESAAITLHFSEVDFADGRTMQIDGQVAAVENARENVTATGKIQGIRSTGTIGHRAENQLGSLAQADPIAFVFTSSAGPALLGFAEPEILYSSGTELQVRLQHPLLTSLAYPATTPHLEFDTESGQRLQTVIKDLSFRTQTLRPEVPSDLTNLVFVGQPEALLRAFQASGWTPADSLTATATFQTVKTLTGNEVYTQAPMSVLTLDRHPPLFTLQKTTNTFSSRHHLRIFQTGSTFDGQPVLTGSSTQDIGIDFSYKQKTFIHVIDQELDNERAKVINDLEFTGCVRASGLIARPAVPLDAYNSTGDRLRTDGAAGVVLLSDCTHPKQVPTGVAERANGWERGERDTLLSIKDSLFRGNVVYTGVSGALRVHHFLQTRNELGPDREDWRRTDAAEATYSSAAPTRANSGSVRNQRLELNGVLSPESQREIAVAERALIETHRWDAPKFEIGLSVGYSYHRNNILETTVLDLQSTDQAKPQYLLGLGDATFDGWAARVGLMVNTWKWFSNEFSYTREQTKFDLIADTISSDPQAEPTLDTQTVGLTTRRFAYDFVVNARPRSSRFRPYVMAGPAFQLVSLSDAPLKKPSGYFRLGLSNVGLFKAAFDFGRTAPLDGGGIFQAGLQYGTGIRYRLAPRVMLRGEYGETWSPNPHIINKSYEGYLPEGLDDSYTTTVTNYAPRTRYFQQHATLGFAFTF